MKIEYFLIVIVLSSFLYAQSTIEIQTGASLDIQGGADICADNFSGTLSGAGTRCNGPLPVELVSFTFTQNNYTIILNWKTATEVNVYGFEIQKSHVTNTKSEIRNSKFETIGFVEGSGNSNSTKDYEFTDNDLKGNIFIYRLKMIDNDGSYEYSNELEVEVISAQFVLYQNSPNPFNPNTKISFTLAEPEFVNMTIYNILGSEVATLVNEKKEAGYYEYEFKGADLTSGIYLYRITAGDKSIVKKMLLTK